MHMRGTTLRTWALVAEFPTQTWQRRKPGDLLDRQKTMCSNSVPSLIGIACIPSSVGESARRGESLLDNIEITNEEREAIAARLRARRLRKRHAMSNDRAIMLDDDHQPVKRGSDGGLVGFETSNNTRGNFEQSSSEGRTSRGLSGNKKYDNYQDSYLGWGEESKNDISWGSDSSNEESDSSEEDSTSARSSFPDEYQDTTNVLTPPDIVILSPDELDRVLPVLPFAAQATFFTGGAAQAVQRWAASLALTVLFSKAAILAATSLTWPLWWPWARAAKKNYGIRSKIEYGGIWRTAVLDIEKGNRPRPQFGRETWEGNDGMPKFSAIRSCRIVIGEEDGAQIELLLPQDARFEVIQPGQPAEVVVLSNSSSFDDIKAVKDVYLPETGLWLSEYPYIDRAEFLEISLDIEREFQFSDE